MHEFQNLQGDVADDRNETIIELGDDRTEKLCIIGKKKDFSTRPRGREEKMPHVPKNIDERRVPVECVGSAR